jgi:hypothetical protein
MLEIEKAIDGRHATVDIRETVRLAVVLNAPDVGSDDRPGVAVDHSARDVMPILVLDDRTPASRDSEHDNDRY